MKKWKQKDKQVDDRAVTPNTKKGQISVNRSNFLSFGVKKFSQNSVEIGEFGISEEAGTSDFFADNFFIL